MNCDELQQLTAIAALGALDGEDLARLRERLEREPAARREFARFCDVVGALASTTIPRRPSPAVRARVLERIRQTPQQRERAPQESPAAPERPPPPTPDLPTGFQFTWHDAPWQSAPLPGARFKLISAAPGQAHVILMIELQPGTVYPEHDHEGSEDMYILTGDLQTEGRSLGPGDALHAEPGTHHHELRTIEGCTALMVLPREAVRMLLPA